MTDKKNTHGGARKGAGRKMGSGRFGEPTQVMRIPVSKIGEIKDMLLKFPKKLKPEPGGTKASMVWNALASRSQPLTLFNTRVAAGAPSPAEDFSDGQLDLNDHLLKNPQSTFFVRVSGDSMINAGIHPEDLLIVDRSIRPAQGRVVIAVVNGELTVKRLFKENNKVFLMPENPNYPALEITEEMDFMIWGVVTNVIHTV
ncbi:DNA polymerase V [Candidatus Paracaedimonas acanthamoebae]|nr:DNA polymerase V [Candidatus Paracaedimonas acanthamoebae]